MKRLRHPIRAIREPFGTAGLVVAMIALVAALGGTALAASKLNSTQKKEVEKIAKKYAGKPGTNGATGPAGAAGAKGDNGAPGTNGTAGTPGSNGTSPVGTAFTGSKTAGGTTCHEGGVEYKGASTNLVCNGEEGEPGEEGSPWTAGGFLPPGATETGTWGGSGAGEHVGIPISLPIPLEASIERNEEHNQVHVTGESEFNSFCEGNVTNPIGSPPEVHPPAPGEVCIYLGAVEGTLSEVASPLGEREVGEGFFRTGAVLWFNPTGEGQAFGTYAVTGCSQVPGAAFPCPQ